MWKGLETSNETRRTHLSNIPKKIEFEMPLGWWDRPSRRPATPRQAPPLRRRAPQQRRTQRRCLPWWAAQDAVKQHAAQHWRSLWLARRWAMRGWPCNARWFLQFTDVYLLPPSSATPKLWNEAFSDRSQFAPDKAAPKKCASIDPRYFLVATKRSPFLLRHKRNFHQGPTSTLP